MSSDQNSSDVKLETPNSRQNLVDTAVSFLLNPAVIDKPITHKTAFLKKKGLTDAEIALAFEKAAKDPKYKNFQRNSSQNFPLAPPPLSAYQKPVLFWTQVSKFTSTVVVVGAAIFGAHYVYKNYIEPFFFGGNSKKDASDQLEKNLQQAVTSLVELDKKLSNLEERVESQNTQITKFFHDENNDYTVTPLALRELKTEIGSVKSLLLSRHQFPALPKVSPPSIPEWQLHNDNSSLKVNEEKKEQCEEPSPLETESPSDESFVNVDSIEKSHVGSDAENITTQSEYSST